MEDDISRFTLISNDAVGFNSTRNESAAKPVMLDFGTNPNSPPSCVDVPTSPIERKEIATQTISAPRTSKFATYDDSKLVSFFRRMAPLVEEELSCGITETYDFNSNLDDLADRYNVRHHQNLTARSLNPEHDYNREPVYSNGAAAWLSILTRNAPLLVLACSPSHEAWCEHFASSIVVFSPRRERFGSVEWTELCTSPVKSCIESLETNPFNRDMFAGGTVSGDVYVWQYESGARTDHSALHELHSESTDCGKVVDMAWIKFNVMSKDFGLLTAHSEGNVILWRIGKGIQKDKTFKIAIPSSATKAVILTQMLAPSNSEFIVGCADGSILLCSTAQLVPLSNVGPSAMGSSAIPTKRNYFAPATTELKRHSFAVTSLQKLEKRKQQQYLVSSDLTGEIYFHDITDAINGTPSLIIKLPLPFKNRVVCTDDTEFIFCPATEGVLEVYRIGSGKVDKIETTGMKGMANLIKVSANGKWLVTGTYHGSFIIYSVELHD